MATRSEVVFTCNWCGKTATLVTSDRNAQPKDWYRLFPDGEATIEVAGVRIDLHINAETCADVCSVSCMSELTENLGRTILNALGVDTHGG